MTRRKTFTPEFKREAVRLLELGERPAAQIARELGVKRNQLYKWQEEVDKHGKEAFPGHGRRSSSESLIQENSRLKQELAKAKEEAEILKKAAAFFARELK